MVTEKQEWRLLAGAAEEELSDDQLRCAAVISTSRGDAVLCDVETCEETGEKCVSIAVLQYL